MNSALLLSLAFGPGGPVGWDGDGFRPTSLTGGPSRHWGVQSGDGGVVGRTALLHRTFTLPADAGTLVFRAAAIRPAGLPDAGLADVLLELPGGVHLRRDGGPLGRWPGVAEYRFPVAEHAGKTVRLLLIDRDTRPGCGLVCSGFRVVPRTTTPKPAESDLARDLVALAKEKGLPPVGRLDSDHFVAMGTAGDELLGLLLHHGEWAYLDFLDHFRQKGFAVRPPAGKLQLVAFDSPAGFEAYLGRKFPDEVTGVYHPASNRLVVYDFARNRTFAGQRDRIDAALRDRQQRDGSLEAGRRLGEFRRGVGDFQATVNTSTVMHELAHQLSFNCGLLNREGDAPAWLVEGLAVYFEPAVAGNWQGPDAPNRPRATTLAGALAKDRLLTLRELVVDDAWLTRGSGEQVLLGYAQGWALFRLLMRDRPRALRRYLETIHPRKTPDHRWTDFAACFGPDVGPLERAYRDYVREVAEQEAER